MYGNMPYTCAMAANRAKRGRSSQPRKSAARTARLETRVTAGQKALIERAAAYQGRSVSDFVVSTLASAAQAVIQDHEVVRIDSEESRAFVELLLNPPEPNTALQAAARKWRRTVVSP